MCKLHALFNLEISAIETAKATSGSEHECNTSSLRRAAERGQGLLAMEAHGNLFKQHPCLFNRVYDLRQRVEAGWHSFKSLMGDLWTIRRSHGF